MQKLYSMGLVLFCAALFPLSSLAQDITPEDGTIKFDKESRPCLVVHVDPEPKMLRKAWKNYLKENYDLKISGGSLMSAERVTVTDISMNAMDFYTQIIEDVNGSEMTVFVRHGYDIYVDPTSNPEEYAKLRAMMEDFLKTYVSSYYQEIIDDTEKKIAKLTKYQQKLERSITKDTNKAEKLRVKAQELEDDAKQDSISVEDTKEKIKQREEKLKRYKKKLAEVR